MKSCENNSFTEQDHFWMRYAIKLAAHAAKNHEVPVGAVLVGEDNQILGEGANCPISRCDPTGHAEIMALRQGALTRGNYRLIDTTLYVTLEPCIMCLGALIHARVKKIIFGAYDPKAGAVESFLQLGTTPGFNHQIIFSSGLLAEECGELLKQFFQVRRARKPLIAND